MRTSDRSPRNTKQSALFIAPNAPTTSARPSSQPLIAPSRTDKQSILFCQEELPRHWRHPSTRRSCTSIPQPAAALPSLYLPSPSIERADRAAYAEGVVPPLPRRAHTVPGTKAGQGAQGAWGCPGPGPLPPRRAGDHARRPGSGRHPAAPRKAQRPPHFPRGGPFPPPKTPKGPVSRRRPAPLRNQARHRQPMRPSAAGGTRAKRRRTTGPPRRTWAWRTGCCPHGPGCRRARAAGCWSPSHAPRA